jgi:DNA adenine methylase
MSKSGMKEFTQYTGDQSLLDALDELESMDETKFFPLRAPFSYPGGKQRLADNIVKLLPHRKSYIEPFGGAASVLLARQPITHELEVYNDAYGGVACFYMCLANPELYTRLIDRLQVTVHSRELFEAWKNWNHEDIVERAARWYYITITSFASIGRNWGRTIAKSGMAGRIQSKLKEFPAIHERMSRVQIENEDWRVILKVYDNPDAVFYMDPPYLLSQPGAYTCEMSDNDHVELMQRIGELEGFVAISGYPCELYDKQTFWTNKIDYTGFGSLDPAAVTSNKIGLDKTRIATTERVWIKA